MEILLGELEQAKMEQKEVQTEIAKTIITEGTKLLAAEILGIERKLNLLLGRCVIHVLSE